MLIENHLAIKSNMNKTLGYGKHKDKSAVDSYFNNSNVRASYDLNIKE